MSIELVMPSNHLIFCHPLLLLPLISPSESVLRIRLPKYWSFSFKVSPSNEYSGLNIDDGLVGSTGSPRDSQGFSPTPQFKSINSSVLSFLHIPTLTSIHDYWENHSLDRWTFLGKVMSLLFNMLSRLVILSFQRVRGF